MLRINLSSKRVEYDLTLSHKITVLRGHSGSGKTHFTKILMMSLKDNGFRMKLSDNSYNIRVIADQNGWYDTIYGLQNSDLDMRYIFILDDMDCIIQKEFSDLVKWDNRNYFLIINRFESFSMESLAGLSISVDAIYDFKTNGRKHWLESHLTITNGVVQPFKYVIVEDSKSGFEFFKAYSKNVMTSNGKSGVYNLIEDNVKILKGQTVLLFVDLAAFGAYIDNVMSICLGNDINLMIPSTYMSFEWLLLYSRFYNYDFTSIDDMFRLGFVSDEKMYAKILKDLSSGKPYPVSDKGSSVYCYIKDCCCMHNACDRGLSGSKLDALFEGTDYEDLFKRLRTSNLIML